MDKRKVRVLIADDEPHIRTLLAAIVTQLGAEVVAEAADGEEAVTLFTQQRPDISMLDINMPRVNGDDAMARIRELDPTALIVMLTAQDSVESVRHCLDLGARNYILKNNSAEKIVELIRESWVDYVDEVRQKREARP